MHRRRFMRTVAQVGALTGVAGSSSLLSALPLPDDGLGWIATPDNKNGRILVVVRLFGGNDGLNTLVPVHDDEYYRLRRDISLNDLSIAADQTLELNGVSHVRMHPAMKGLATLYNEGKVAVVQGVGYPNMDLSHFRGTNIWLSASDSNVFATDGWMGRYLERRLEANDLEMKHPFAIECGPQLGRAFAGKRVPMGFAFTEHSNVPDALGPTDETSAAHDIENIITSFEDEGSNHLRSLSRTLATTKANPASYYVNGGNLAPDLMTVSRCIRGGLATPMYIVHTGQFDTHYFQPLVHNQQLDELCTNLLAFQRELEHAGVDDRVTIMVISEFGRRPNTNNSGTDHGTAGPVFLIGRNVNDGMHGVQPTTTDLDVNGNMHWHVDFRSIYASILEQWFESEPSFYIPSALARPFPTLPLFRMRPRPADRGSYSLAQPLLWPNPCSSKLRISVADTFTGTLRVTITTVQGAPIRVADVPCELGSCEIDVSSLSQGSYLVHMTSGAGSAVTSIVVAR